ncbi:microcystinase C (plasmid) [Arthrobacter sp. StoSoilB3]|nr:microcystinase C [Arthrobacter sp. StoSoilB3]
MTKKVAVGGIFHETNTYAAATTLANFSVFSGEELTAAYLGTETYLGGILEGLHQANAEAIPVLYAEATPSGTITKETWTGLRDRLIEGIITAQPDSVVLSLHGAGVANDIGSIEEDLLRILRNALGPTVPVFATLDLHGNLRPELARHCQGLLPVRLNPHTDQHEQGLLAAELSCAEDAHIFSTVIEKIPMMFPPLPTTTPALAAVNSLCRQLEEEKDLVAVRAMHGFPYADVPGAGASVVVVARSSGASELAAQAVGHLLWERRHELSVNTHPVHEAVRLAGSIPGPVVVNEYSDNTGAGAPGDATHLLRALVEAETDACFSHIYDPDVVEQAHKAGVGAIIDIFLGAKSGPYGGTPLAVSAEVLSLGRAQFSVKSAMGRGEPIDLGMICTLRIQTVDVIVSSGRRQTLDDRWFIKAGLDISEYPVTALKSSQHFRAFFEPLAHTIITADAPGLSSADLSTFPRHNLHAPCWPLDTEASYPFIQKEHHEYHAIQRG